MEELIELLERYAPGYRTLIKGVHDWRLEELEEVFGHPLPGFYKEFSRAMGQEGGPLLADVHGYEPITIATHYRLDHGVLPPRRFLYIFGDPSFRAQHYWLDLEAPSEGEDCQVVRMPIIQVDTWRKDLVRCFVSLREMLFLWAMEKVRLPTLPHQAQYYRGAKPRLPEEMTTSEELATLFERMGFTRLTYPRHCMLFEREEAGIALYRVPDEPGFSFRVGMNDPRELKRFLAIINENTTMEELFPRPHS